MCLEFMRKIFSTEPSGKFLFSRYLSRTNLTKLLWVIFMVLVLGSTVSGCSPFYVMRAAYEEGKILWRREPIADFIERPGIAADTKEKLALVLAVREYAKKTLKLNVGRSYSTYSYVDRPDLTYILTAAPKTELKPYTWWFLVVGRVPYKGYFSREEAETAAEELRADGYDTNVRTSAAFSTLGWFDDPLLGHLLKYDKVTLAEVIFHELFHSTLYVKGAGNFNESVANFVGGHAAIDFFRDKFGEGSAEHQRAMRNWEAELEFSGFIERFAGALTELYTRNIPYEDKLRLREAVFSQFKNEWAERLANRSTHRFRGFAHQPVNNALIIHYQLYLRNLEIFESIYQAEGQSLVRTIAVIRDAVEKGGEPFEQVRSLIDKHKASS
jgi:predicted aminopeptidase